MYIKVHRIPGKLTNPLLYPKVGSTPYRQIDSLSRRVNVQVDAPETSKSGTNLGMYPREFSAAVLYWSFHPRQKRLLIMKGLKKHRKYVLA